MFDEKPAPWWLVALFCVVAGLSLGLWLGLPRYAFETVFIYAGF